MKRSSTRKGKNIHPDKLLTRILLWWSVVLLVLLVVACRGIVDSTTALPPEHPVIATVTLEHMPTGKAHLAWHASTHTLEIQLSLMGLAPKSVHPAHIHAETCLQDLPTILWSLPLLRANAAGEAMLSTVLTGVTRFPASASLNVHNGPGLATSEQHLPIACGDITLSNDQAQVSMQATMAPNQQASGEAHLTLEHQTLTVTLHLHGLVPLSLHATHIHAGGCNRQGPMHMEMRRRQPPSRMSPPLPRHGILMSI